MKEESVGYSKEEASMLKLGTDLLKEVLTANSEGMKKSAMKTKTELVTMYNLEDRSKPGCIYGASTVIVNASPTDVMAHLWNFNSRMSLNSAMNTKHVIDRRKFEVKGNSHKQTTYLATKAVGSFAPREFINVRVWHKCDTSTYILVSVPVESLPNGASPIPGCARALCTSVARIKEIEPGRSSFELVNKLQDNLPIAVFKKLYLPLFCSPPWEVYNFFLKEVDLNGMSSEVARELGEALVLPLDMEGIQSTGVFEERFSSRLEIMKSRYRCLKQIDEKYPFFIKMMLHLLRNR